MVKKNNKVTKIWKKFAISDKIMYLCTELCTLNYETCPPKWEKE